MREIESADGPTPALHAPDGSHVGVLSWQWPTAMAVLSSAPVGGGFATATWIMNIGVPLTYCRTDLAQHSDEVAASLGLSGPGVALFTAAEVEYVQRSTVGGVIVDATIGISKPTWAADPGGGWNPWQPGTVNIVVELPMPLDPAAAVNAVITATEAKTQAFMDNYVPGTGTASDAIAIVWPTTSTKPAESFAGPRSDAGSRIAQAVHAAVATGIQAWRARAIA